MAASSTFESPARKRARLIGNDISQPEGDDRNKDRSDGIERISGHLPCLISNWTEIHLQHLSIKIAYEEDLNPMTLIEPFLPSHISHILSHIEKFFTDFCVFHRYILNDELNCISRTVAKDLCSKAFHESTIFINSKFFKELSSSEQKPLKSWLERVDGCGVRFGKTLFNMILKRDLYTVPSGGTEPLCKHDFQFLFDSFVSIFGLQSGHWFDPVILPDTLTLSEADISGKADILFCEDIEDVSEKSRKLQDVMNIVAVCEVRKNSCDQLEASTGHTLNLHTSSGILHHSGNSPHTSSTSASRPSHISSSSSHTSFIERPPHISSQLGHTSSRNNDRPPHISSQLGHASSRNNDRPPQISSQLGHASSRNNDRPPHISSQLGHASSRNNDRPPHISSQLGHASSSNNDRPPHISSQLGHASSSNNDRPPHISSSLLGQHGGKLLLYRKQSVLRHKDVIIGIIVQNTKVSFTALRMTEDEYDGIKTGRHRSTSPKLFITKPYDFLRKDERTHLIRPLIGLALLQSVT